MKCSGNHLRICKVKEVNGEMVKPEPCEVFHIAVESCSQRRYYILNAKNCFCVELDHLCNETYCVYEEDECENEVTYEVDGRVSPDGCVNFCEQDFHHITIINHETPCVEYGCLKIKKHVIDECGNEISHCHESFRVEVVGDDFRTTLFLNHANHFQAMIDDLPYGEYEVREIDGEGYDVTYVVDGVESEFGNIMIDSPRQRMDIYNRANNGMHVLRICKWIRKDGRLVKPTYDQSFDIAIDNGYAVREYTLNCANHFCESIEGNKNDTYILQELDACNVEYEVDGEMVDRVEVTMDQDHDVRIINLDNSGSGMFVVRKWIEEDGRLMIPRMDEVFYVRIQGYSEETFELNFDNDFTLMFNDVAPGYYNVYEESGSIYDVSYEVNGVSQDDGYFYVEEGGEAFINIINHKRCPSSGGNIHLMKRVNVPCNNDEVAMPLEGSFEIYIEGPEGGNYFMLDANNNYEMDYPAMNGWYTIYEVNPCSMVTYRLDGVDYNNEVHFFVDDSNHEVMIINHVNKVNFVI